MTISRLTRALMVVVMAWVTLPVVCHLLRAAIPIVGTLLIVAIAAKVITNSPGSH
jgi:tryptophan-rich sensory protein